MKTNLSRKLKKFHLEVNLTSSKSYSEKIHLTETMLDAERNALQLTKKELGNYKSIIAERYVKSDLT